MSKFEKLLIVTCGGLTMLCAMIVLGGGPIFWMVPMLLNAFAFLMGVRRW